MGSSGLDKSLTECLSGEIVAFVRDFTETDVAAKQSLQQLYTGDPVAFCIAAVPALAACGVTPGSRYVVHLLLKEGLLVRALIDPDRCHRDEAVAVVRNVGPMGSALEAELERALSTNLRSGSGPDIDARVMRLLDLMHAASAERRCLLFQGELLNSPNPQIRSKAALLIARSSRTVSLAGRLMLDRDTRVQANAVEALWSFDAADSGPLLSAASRSPVPRVAANAAVGLYRIGDVNSIRLLWQMAGSADPKFRQSGIWAMGETGDSRFLPYLTEQYRKGDRRALVMGAISRIRMLQKQSSPEPVEIRIHGVELEADGTRKVTFGIWGASFDPSAVRTIDLSVSEEGVPAVDFTLASLSNPAILMTSFILPRAASVDADYSTACLASVERCLRFKRDEDLWRLDRYSTRSRLAPSDRSKNPLPYDETLGGPTVKALRGFVTERERVSRILATEGAREQAAHDLPAALDRVAEAMEHLSGTRHIFVLLSPEGPDYSPHPAWANQFAQSLEDQRIRMYVIAPSGLDWTGDGTLMALESMPGCSVLRPPQDGIADIVEEAYARLLNVFELRYRVHTRGRKGHIALHSAKGQGTVDFRLGAA